MKLSYIYPLIILTLNISLTDAQDYKNQINEYLNANLESLNLERKDILNFDIYRNYYSSKTNLQHVFINQSINNLNIHKAEIRLHYNSEIGWICSQNTFVKQINSKEIQSSVLINEFDALNFACNNVGIKYKLPKKVINDENNVIFKTDYSLNDIPVKQLYYHEKDKLIKVWNLSIYTKDANNYWDFFIDCTNGNILKKYNWVKKDEFNNFFDEDYKSEEISKFSYNQEKIQNNLPSYNVLAFPIESPSHGERSIVVNPTYESSSPFGWHDTNGSVGNEYTITRGNNVHAYPDLFDLNYSQGYEPDGGDSLLFDFPFNEMDEPDQYREASTVNLFYINNLMHDVWYNYGFDPQAGNFQYNNYGEGGYSNDYVVAESQDSSLGTNFALNNANFMTPPDGQNPRMQMYIYEKSDNPYDLFTVNFPDFLAGNYEVNPANGWGGEVTSEPITGNIEHVDDGTINGHLGCEDLTNDLFGKIALVSRGTCEFGLKSLNAQNAGAIAVIIYNNVNGIVTMGAGEDGANVSIPSVFIDKIDGELLRDNLFSGEIIEATFVNNTPPGPDYLDTDFDNGIIVHEYGHGISGRLAGINCLDNDEQAGEGWSDFFSLVMTTNSNNYPEEPRGIGTYVSAQSPDGRGFRPFRYSRDMTINPVTYDYIITTYIPHGLGSVWTSMLWDLYWNFVDLYGFSDDIYEGEGGNNMVMQLVIDGLKLQPCEPTFTDMRDAILLADQILYEGKNSCLIWQTFARRGLGYSAESGSSSSRSDGREAFDILPSCLKSLKIQKTGNSFAKAGESINYEIKIDNHTDDILNNVIIKDTLDASVSFQNSSNCDVIENNNILTFDIGELLAGESRTCNFSVLTDPLLHSEVLFFDDLEDGDFNWNIESETELFWELENDNPYSGSDAFFAENSTESYESHLELSPFLVQGQNPTLSFWHEYITESGFDGGTISISLDGTNYEDLGENIIRGSYRGLSQGPPPLGGKNSYWGDSQGFINTLVDLSSFIGENVTIRFSFMTDDENGENVDIYGWTIDDISIIDRFQVLNKACVSADNYSSVCSQVKNGGTLINEEFEVDIKNPVNENTVNVFPNPSNNFLDIKLSPNWDSKINIKLYDMNGKVLINNFYETTNIRLKTEFLSNGIYFIDIQDSRNLVTKKISIKH